jgi:hypothetical protein
LRSLAQVFSLLGMTCRRRHNQKCKRPNGQLMKVALGSAIDFRTSWLRL